MHHEKVQLIMQSRILRALLALVSCGLLLAFFIGPPPGHASRDSDTLCPDSPPGHCQRLVTAEQEGQAGLQTLPHAALAEGPSPAPAPTARYRLNFVQADTGRAPPAVGLCLLRSPLLARATLDGVEVYRDTPGIQDIPRFLRPLYLAASPGLAPGPHTLVLDVQAPPGVAAGLGPVWVGDSEALRRGCQDLAWQIHDRVHGVTWVMVAMGLAGLLLWWSLGERAALWFALTALAWVAHLLVVSLSWPSLSLEHWSLLFFTTRVAFLPPMLLFSISVAGSRLETHHRVVLGVYGGGLAVLWLLPAVWREHWLITMAAITLPAAITVQWALVRGLRHALSMSRLLMTLSFALVVIAHAMDMRLWWIDGGYGSKAWTYVAVPLLCAGFGIRLIERLIGHARRDARAAARLRQEVEAQRVRIAADYQRLQQQREQLAVLEERRRIVRDMHDGLGVYLLSASALLKHQPQLSPQQVAETLDDALKELRSVLDVLSVDPSSDPDDDPVSSLLGTLRWRIAPALQANGITLKWQCDALPAPFLAADSARMHLMRLMQEAFSNILKHSRASSACFQAAVLAGGGVRMALSDDGLGFTADQRHGIGLDSMRARASAIGATMTVHTAPGGGTTVELLWP